MEPLESILDRLWLWGMKVNSLQASMDYGKWGFAPSTLTTEQAIEQTGIRNVLMGGGLEISEQTLASMPSARRIICKTSLHKYNYSEEKFYLDCDDAESQLLAAKHLAGQDTRVEAFQLDDFSTGSVDAGVSSTHLAKLQYTNATVGPQMPLCATIYMHSLEREGLADLLRYFDGMMLTPWFADEIDKVPEAVERCAELSGDKPAVVCLYFYDFGKKKAITRDQMQHQLDVVEPLIRSQRIAGLVFLGTCMMDLGWDSTACVYDWISKVG